MIRSIRGAITIEENTREQILENTKALLSEIIKANGIETESIVNIIFTSTKDIYAAYPAIAAREIGIIDAGLMCTQEMYVEGSLAMCIRALVTIETDKKQSELKHIYLKKAKRLRPDLSMPESGFSVAIDGPAGSGKSTVAKMIAVELGLNYVDTGAMYRAVGIYCSENNIDYNDADAVKAVLDDINLSVEYENNEQKTFINGIDYSDKIRTGDAAKGASAVAVIKEVRQKLVSFQQELAQSKNIIMDGRDIGTCVLPNASVKIYMDADIERRAERRCGELRLKGENPDFEAVRADVQRRDENDKNRAVSPLAKADDAILVDTTDMNIEQSEKAVINIIKERM